MLQCALIQCVSIAARSAVRSHHLLLLLLPVLHIPCGWFTSHGDMWALRRLPWIERQDGGGPDGWVEQGKIASTVLACSDMELYFSISIGYCSIAPIRQGYGIFVQQKIDHLWLIPARRISIRTSLFQCSVTFANVPEITDVCKCCTSIGFAEDSRPEP